MRLSHLYVSNLLGVREADIELSTPVTLIAGANGAGKSSLRDAIVLALTGIPPRVSLMKDGGKLVTEGQRSGEVMVRDSDGDEFRATATLTGGVKVKKGDVNDPLFATIGAQRFASMPIDQRRTLLFELASVSVEPEKIKARLLKRKHDAGRVEKILPLLRSGFPAAHTQATHYAAEARGAWKAITGEVYGSQKADRWAAPAPGFEDTTDAQLRHDELKAAIDADDQILRKMDREKAAFDAETARLPGLNEQAMRLERAQRKLDTDRQTLADARVALQKCEEQAGTGKRVGLVHDLARAVVQLMLDVEPKRESVKAGFSVIQDYEAQHGALAKEGTGDPLQAARLPELRHAVETAERAVANDVAAVEQCNAAALEIKRIEAAPKFDTQPMVELSERLRMARAELADLKQKIDTQNALRVEAGQAKARTSEAARHHADVLAWIALAEDLAPTGLPVEMSDEALKPVNERLAQDAADTGWPTTIVGRDMSVLVGGREYALLSESEQWRADAMLAEAIAYVSGTRLLLLDRFDVLDLAGRSELLGWLDTLADAGEIATAIVLGTLKAPPAGLPATIAVHWLKDGVLTTTQPRKEAA